MAESLNPDGTPILLGAGDIQLATPGLTGVAEVLLPGTTGIRGEEQATEEFLAVLTAAGFVEQLTVAIVDQAELDPGAGGTRGAGGGADIVVDVPGPGTGFAQVLLYTAEDGSQTWHLPENIEPDGARQPARGSDRRTYRVPRVVVPARPGDQAASRGLIAAAGKKLLKVVAFPLVELGAEFVADKLATRWEAAHRPHRLRSFTPTDYRDPRGSDLGDADVAGLAGGRALMFLHGTFSTARSAFGPLPGPTLDAFHNAYQGRVFAFDHPSISVSPTVNAQWLATRLEQALPAGTQLEVDVIAHSRGGLVGRELCEYTQPLGFLGRLSVNRLVMVGTPNAGTALADVAHWKAYIDRMTNILQFFPDNPVTDTMDAVLTLLKHVALGAIKGLDGLRSMDPGGDYLTERLNLATLAASPSTYLAVAANYEPEPGSAIAGLILDRGVDLVFRGAANDLVVPTDGVFTVPGAPGFPVATPLVFPPGDGVDHLGYFRRPEVGSGLLEWLTA